MKHQAQELCERISELVLDVTKADAEFLVVDSVENFSDDSLIFVDTAENLPANGRSPAVLVTSRDIAKQVDDDWACVISVSNVRLAQALAKQAFADYDSADNEWGDVHPSATIHPSVRLGKGVRIGPNSVIGKGVKLGDNTHVRSNCVIESRAKIGRDCVINNLVNIGADCVLGERVIVRPGAIIGNEGFGFAQDDQRHYHRIPHTGNVVIGDDVQIGSNCNIDRATYGSTTIARGVKIDALCHIAHNVSVDEDALFVAQSGVAGSSNVGKRVIASGQTGVLDHRTIVDDAILVHRCGVTEDITEPGIWAGTPPKPFKEYVRQVGLAKKVAKLSEELKELKRPG